MERRVCAWGREKVGAGEKGKKKFSGRRSTRDKKVVDCLSSWHLHGMTCTKGLLLVKAILSLCRKKLQSTGHTELSGYCADRPCGLASECGALLRPRNSAEKRKENQEKEREKKNWMQGRNKSWCLLRWWYNRRWRADVVSPKTAWKQRMENYFVAEVIRSQKLGEGGKVAIKFWLPAACTVCRQIATDKKLRSEVNVKYFEQEKWVTRFHNLYL